jgi:hypothetical protein
MSIVNNSRVDNRYELKKLTKVWGIWFALITLQYVERAILKLSQK